MNFTKGNSVNSLTDKSYTFAIYNLIQLILITIKLLNYWIVKESGSYYWKYTMYNLKSDHKFIKYC